MKIICPHCNNEFEEADAIIKPRKEKYKWYEFSGKVSLCPACNNRYIVDISIKGLIFIFTIFPIIIFCANSNYNLAAIAIALFAVIVVKVFRQKLVVVKGVNT